MNLLKRHWASFGVCALMLFTAGVSANRGAWHWVIFDFLWVALIIALVARQEANNGSKA